MDAVSLPSDEMARKSHSMVLRALASKGQEPMAQVLKVSEATVSRMKDVEIERVCRLISELGFKVVDANKVCVRHDEYLTMTRIVSRALANEETARHLLFEDAE